MSKEAIRYVEVSYRLPDTELIQFRAVVTRAGSPNDAVREAADDTLRAHPEAIEVEEFMQRIVSEEKAGEILQAFNDGKWGGWTFRS